MKKHFLFLLGVVCAVQGVQAQFTASPAYHPVYWHYRLEQVQPDGYRLHMVATIGPGWHLYSQHQPADAIAIPTAIHFLTDTSVVSLKGQPVERGRLETFEDKALGISARQYEDSVDFVQRIHWNHGKPATIAGSITYQACRKEECLQPVTTTFKLLLK